MKITDSAVKHESKRAGDKNIIKGLGVTGISILLFVVIVFGIFYALIISPALYLRSSVNALKKDSTQIIESLRNRDLVTLEENLVNTEKDLNKLKQDREKKFGWAKDFKYFKLNEYYSDSDKLINAAFYAIDALREVEAVAKPFASAAGLRISAEEEIVEEEGLMKAFQSWVSIMPDVANQMDGVIVKVAKVGDELKSIDTTKYPKSLNGVEVRGNLEFIKNTLSKADEYGPDIKQALTLFPRVLAVGTPEKRYMVIMQNDKEIRPAGGFMTNYATFKIKDGLLGSDFTSKDMYSVDLTLDAIDATYDFPDAPAPYTKYLKVERWYARDMNYSPDFINSMDQFLKFYNMASNIFYADEIKPVDGIVAIDTQVVKELLDVTGPVTVNGVTYNGDNVVLELERIASLELREQVNRKRVLGELMENMLINVFESDKNLWSRIIDKAVDLAMRKHVQVYVFDPDAQKLIEKYGLAGRIPEQVEGDYSMVVSTNLGGDKTNWFTTKTVNHTLQKEGGKWLRTVKIDYTYNEPSADFAPFVKRFRDWVRVYAPSGSQFIGVEGSEDGTTTEQERNKVWYSGYIELGPGESKTMTFKYYIPDSAVGADTYILNIQKQAGIEREQHNITVNGKTERLDLTKDTKATIKLK